MRLACGGPPLITVIGDYSAHWYDLCSGAWTARLGVQHWTTRNLVAMQDSRLRFFSPDFARVKRASRDKLGRFPVTPELPINDRCPNCV